MGSLGLVLLKGGLEGNEKRALFSGTHKRGGIARYQGCMVMAFESIHPHHIKRFVSFDPLGCGNAIEHICGSYPIWRYRKFLLPVTPAL